MKPLAVYVHIPFCVSKCGYCDFNAYAGMDHLKGEYTNAIIREIRAWNHVLRERRITSLGFGGGTPGEMPAEKIAAVVDAVRREAPLDPDAEVSLEANPGSSDARHLTALAQSGVNRISFGAQSFDEAELRFLDRIHSPEAVGAAVRLARQAGIASVGLDLIYGLPDQAMETWQSSVERALALEPDHLSLYALTIEDGTPLGARVERGDVELLEPDSVADMYEHASDWLEAAGFRQYELSNWARPGHESRHNQVYWTGGDYLGIGAGAHGFIDGLRYENMAHPRAYLASAETLQPRSRVPNTVIRSYRPDAATAMSDWLSLALRRLAGASDAAFAGCFGRSLDDVFGPALQECETAGVIDRCDGVTRLTRRGRLLHGEVSVRLMTHAAGAERLGAGSL